MGEQRSMTLDSLRRTGRTHRMLAEAVTLAKAGKRVAIVVSNMATAALLGDRLRAVGGQDFLRNPGSNPDGLISVVGVDRLDWRDGSIVGLPGTEVLVDHACIEERCGPFLAQWLRHSGLG